MANYNYTHFCGCPLKISLAFSVQPESPVYTVLERSQTQCL